MKEEIHPHIKYIQGHEIGPVLISALTSAVKHQPEKPLTYIINWLFNYSKSNEIQKKVYII